MPQIASYLTFSGNCREAMLFYKDCLGGELAFQTVGESPLADKMPQRMRECILHATLASNTFLLMGTDMVPSTGLVKGNALSLSLNCYNEEEIEHYYTKLSAGGSADHPLEDTFWGARFGNLTDRFGNHWILNFNRTE